MVSAAVTRADELLAGQARVLEQIVRGAPLQEVLAALCAMVEAHAGSEVRAAILLASDDGKRLFSGAAPSLPAAYSAAVDGLPIDADVGTCCAAAARREVVITPDIASDPRWATLCHLVVPLGLAAAWSMPIMSSANMVLGTIGTYFFENREPTPAELRLVEVLARTAALAIERDRADHALRESTRRLQFLAELQAATQALIEPTDSMATIARMLAEHLGADRCAYAEVEDERVFVITGDHTRDVPSIVGNWDVAAFGPACLEAMLAGKPFVVDDTDTDPRIGPEQLPAYRATTIRAVICVPLHKAGKFTAAMAVHQRAPRQWSANEIDLVTTVVSSCWEALERSRVTRVLVASEARYRTMLEATPECVKVVGPDGTLLQMNAAGLRMLEADEQALGTCVYDAIAPEFRERFRAFNEQVCRGQGGELEFEIIGAQGTRRVVQTTAVPVASTTGGFVHLAITRDVTARVAADRALAESRARLEYAVRLSGIGFWYCDLPFDALVWDARAKEHFFLPADAPVSMDIFYAHIHPDDRETTRQAIETSISERAPYDVVYRTCNPATGAIKYIRALGGTTYAPDGTPVRFDGVTVDVTAQRLQDRRKDEFIATLAHELRNPLAPIRTGLQLLQHSPDVGPKVLPMMDRQLGHLVRMVDDLLDISRVTLGKIQLVKERVDLRAVLDSALETARSLVEAGGHELGVRLPPTPLPLEVDPTRLSQVFSNLINNAAKYTPSGGRIAIAADVKGDSLEVSVSDTGIGIPEDMLPVVFDMFTQVGRSIDRSQGGLGIGLTLVRRLVEMHGGSVAAHSAGIGEGSTFTVRIPIAEPRQAVAAGPLQTTRAAAADALRVLVVDDNVDAAETLAMLLEVAGNHTRLAHTGADALEAVREFAPDIVFLDIGLPEMNGYEVATRLRADDKLRQPVLVALTGWGSEDDRRQAHAAGFDRHLVKPIDRSKIDEVLTSARG